MNNMANLPELCPWPIKIINNKLIHARAIISFLLTLLVTIQLLPARCHQSVKSQRHVLREFLNLMNSIPSSPIRDSHLLI